MGLCGVALSVEYSEIAVVFDIEWIREKIIEQTRRRRKKEKVVKEIAYGIKGGELHDVEITRDDQYRYYIS